MASNEVTYGSEKAFGGKAALSFERDRSKADSAGKQEHRVSVQGAPSTGPQVYDWAKKVVVQRSPKESAALYAVMMGAALKFEAAQHGTAKDKTFAIELQASGVFYVKVMQSNKGVFGVPVTPADMGPIAVLVFDQYAKNFPGIDQNVLRESILGPYRAVKERLATKVQMKDS